MGKVQRGDITTDKHKEILKGILSKNNMIVHNDGQTTRRAKSSVIDRVIRSATLSSTVASCDTLTHEVIRSDHGIIFNIHIKMTN